MNKRQVIILWAVAFALGGAVTAVKFSQNKATKVTTERKAGDTLFQAFPASEASTITIQGAEDIVTLTKKDGKWLVAERGDFPANNTYVNDLIRTLGDLKITQAMEAGPSFAPRFGMDDTSANAAEHGLIASFKDASGKELAKVALGKNIESGAASSPVPGMGGAAIGRYVRNYADESGFYAVGEMFPSVSADAKRWLSDGFISPEKIKTITVTAGGKADLEWKLTRETEEAEFKLEGATATEVLNTTASASLKSLFSYARFEDVVPADKVAELTGEGDKRVVKIETAEGFTYTLNITPTKPPVATPLVDENAPPAATDNYLLTVEVDALLPTERKKEEGEKPEDATAKDAAFTERHKALTEKLAKEKAFAGITFEVSKSLVDPVLQGRAALTAVAAPPEEGADAGHVQAMPGGMIARPPNRPARPPVSATTPPIQATAPPISVPSIGEDDDDDSAKPGTVIEDDSGDDEEEDEGE